ncbi:MAG: hypothetical protein VX408_01465 [Pseudomonadota bacterium]|nr:hypothetical protein [Pseudomonadota bacterium]MED6317183.1 hypothetical protein [Pseudomonadota bacterium]
MSDILNKLGLGVTGRHVNLTDMLSRIDFKVDEVTLRDVTIANQSFLADKNNPRLWLEAEIFFDGGEDLDVAMTLDFEQAFSDEREVSSNDKAGAIEIIKNAQMQCGFGVKTIETYETDGKVEAEISTKHQEVTDFLKERLASVETWTSEDSGNGINHFAVLSLGAGGQVQRYFASLINNGESELAKNVMAEVRKAAIAALSE